MSASSESSSSSLPDEIIQSIAISNAKSIGEQPAILANLALANQILNQNLQQQSAISMQQAINQITLATAAKCVSVITSGESTEADEKKIQEVQKALSSLQDYFNKQNPAP